MLREADLDDYAEICADAEVMRFSEKAGLCRVHDAWRQMAMIIGHWQLRGYGPWAIEERSTYD